MNIGKSYSLSLLASISATITMRNVKLVAISDASSGQSIRDVITEHEQNKFRLPDTLKYINIYQDLFYHFRDAVTGRTVIVPYSYINQSTVAVSLTHTRTLVFTLDSNERYAELVKVLTDNTFTYQET